MGTLTAGTFVVFGAGFVVFSTAWGISKLASSAVEGIARQPEAAAKIQTAMIVAAALIEGVAFFCAVICLMALNK